jgi:hypothetical protein
LALLDSLVADPEHEHALLLAKTLCAYRTGRFEESIELDRQISRLNPDQARVRAIAAADARLSAALRDSRAATRKELTECGAAILGAGLPDGYATISAYGHSKALLALASGDPETSVRIGLDVLRDKSIVPADRAMVIAMVVIAGVRAGDLHVARWWDPKVPDWCPLRSAVDRELGRCSPQGDPEEPRDDSDCLVVE